MKIAQQIAAITNIEKALKVSSARSLTNKNLFEFDRIYFGHEFCERLLPDSDQVKRALGIIKQKNKKLSLLTPSATEYGLKNIRSLVSLLDKEDEVIVNDYGVLNMIGKEFKNPILIGRVLGRIVLPTLEASREKSDILNHYLSLLGQKVRGLETDLFNASVIDSFLAKQIYVSLYVGPVVWTTTKRCAFNTRATTLKKFCMCKRECLKGQAIIENTAVKKHFFLKGNTFFSMAEDAQEIANIDFFKRTVFELTRGA